MAGFKNIMIEKFVKYFTFFGSLYILGLPGVVMISNLFIPDYFKYKFTGVCNLAIQFIFIAGSLIMLLGRNSLYNKIRIKKKLKKLPFSDKNE